MKNTLPKLLKHVMLRTRRALPEGCVIERGTLWINPPGVECPGFQIQGPGGKFATLTLNEGQLYMEFKVGDGHLKEVFCKKLDDDFVNSTAMLLRRLFNDGTAPCTR